MSRRRRNSTPLVADRLEALVRHPLIHHIGAALPVNDVGRPRHHPAAAHLAFGALARLWRSGARIDGELPALWPAFVEGFNAGADTAQTEPIDTRVGPVTWHHFRRARDRMTDDVTLAALRDAFTAHSLAVAHDLGLLRSNGPGSLTRPDPSRLLYGDGTIVRPMYRNATELDDDEKAKTSGRTRRQDPDAELHVRHDGTIIGHNFVTLCARTPDRWGRVVLAVDHVPAPGQEAATAVELVEAVHAHAGTGIQAVVYDGAFTGVHIERLMTHCGLQVINKVASAPTPAELKAAGTKLPKHHVLGIYTHTPADGRGDCKHTVVARAGALVEVDLDDAGEPIVIAELRRKQVKRYRRPGGGYRFSLGAELPCPRQPFTIWVSPHPNPGDTDHRRPENIRLLPPADDAFDPRYAVRNDAESFNAHFKATLLVDRAMSLGWRRQLIDLLAFGILTNTWAARRQDTSTQVA